MLTQLDDLTSDLVIAELYRRDVPVVRLDPGVPDAARFAAYAGPEESWSGRLTTPSRTLRLENTRSVYYRRPSAYGAPDGLDGQQRTFVHAQLRHGFGGLLAALPDCVYVNHPHSNWGAEYKPRQIDAALRAGLAVPPTLITNDPAAARAFAADVGPVVYKPLWSTAYHENGDPRTVWVRTVDPAELDDSVAACPHLFQQVVLKSADVRVAAVDSRSFASRIVVDSGGGGSHLDWRQHYECITFTPTEVPRRVEEGVRAYLGLLGLMFGAFDFAVDRDSGDWKFLECNPNGQWAFVDDVTTRAISMALADLLERGHG